MAAVALRGVALRWLALSSLAACALLAPPVSLHALAWCAFAPILWLAVTQPPARAAWMCASVGAAYIGAQTWPFLTLGWWGWGSARADEAARFLLQQRALAAGMWLALAAWSAVCWAACGYVTAHLARRDPAGAGASAARIVPSRTLTPYVRWSAWPAALASLILGVCWLGVSARPYRVPGLGMNRTGFSMLEVLMASLVASVVAAGTMASFITAVRITRQHNSPEYAEASGYAQQTLERIRNAVAANPAPGTTWFQDNATGAWIDDPLPGGGGSESIQAHAARRCFFVTPRDCDNDGAAANPPVEEDCYSVSVQVCWRDLGTCQCP